MLSSLSGKLQDIFDKLRGQGRLSDSDVSQALREIKLVLLEADVNFRVVKDFIASVKAKAVGEDVLRSVTPGQQVVKIVHDELVRLLGEDAGRLQRSSAGPTVIMLVGLQGSGKTTTAAKIACMLQKEGKQVLLAAADVYRPAAVKQLQVLAESAGVPVFTLGDGATADDVVRAALAHLRRHGMDTLIIDTAGRLHVDESMMAEIARLEEIAEPDEVLLVLDAAIGQEAVTVAEEFGRRVKLTGYVMSRFDSDTRGGAALSIRAVTGLPIKLIGIGEKLEAIELFQPERIASRILGMGDILTLVEKAQRAVDADESARLEKKMRAGSFDLDDFAAQMKQMRNMGPLDQVLAMIPGFDRMKSKMDLSVDESRLTAIEAMISSMTRQERAEPRIIDGSRRRRIAGGSGRTVQEVNALLKQFEQARKMMRKFADMEHKSGGAVGPGRLPF